MLSAGAEAVDLLALEAHRASEPGGDVAPLSREYTRRCAAAASTTGCRRVRDIFVRAANYGHKGGSRERRRRWQRNEM